MNRPDSDRPYGARGFWRLGNPQDFILGYFRFLSTGNRQTDCPGETGGGRVAPWDSSLVRPEGGGHDTIFVANAFFFAALRDHLSSN
jgi:hypothetical protein